MLKLTYPAVKPVSQLTSAYPWAWYSMSDGAVDGATQNSLSNDARATALPDLGPATDSLTTMWTGRNGWLTLNGTTQSISESRATDPVAMDSVFGCDDGCMLIGIQCNANTSLTRDSILHIGGDSGGQQYGIYMFKEASNRPGFLLRDDADNQGALQFFGPASPVTMDGATDFNLFLVIDNRAGVKAAVGYGQDASDLASDPLAGNTSDLTALGALPLNSAKSTGQVHLGRKGGSSAARYSGAMRRMLVINFGQDKPDNLTDIINDLHKSAMIPTWLLP